MVQQQSEVNRRLNLLLQHDPILNSFAMNHPEEAIRLAMRPITDDEFQDVAFQMMTQGEIDTTLNQLVGMDPAAQRAAFFNFSPGRQRMLNNVGYQPPDQPAPDQAKGGGGNWLTRGIATAGGAIGKAVSYPLKGAQQGAGLIFKAFDKVDDQLFHAARAGNYMWEQGSADVITAWDETGDPDRDFFESTENKVREMILNSGLSSSIDTAFSLLVDHSAGDEVSEILAKRGIEPHMPEFQQNYEELISLLSDPASQSVIRELNRGRVSPGGMLLNYALPWVDPLSAPGQAITMGTNLAYILVLDPLDWAFRFNFVRKVSKYGIRIYSNSDDLKDTAAGIRGVDAYMRKEPEAVWKGLMPEFRRSKAVTRNIEYKDGIPLLDEAGSLVTSPKRYGKLPAPGIAMRNATAHLHDWMRGTLMRRSRESLGRYTDQWRWMDQQRTYFQRLEDGEEWGDILIDMEKLDPGTFRLQVELKRYHDQKKAVDGIGLANMDTMVDWFTDQDNFKIMMNVRELTGLTTTSVQFPHISAVQMNMFRRAKEAFHPQKLIGKGANRKFSVANLFGRKVTTSMLDDMPAKEYATYEEMFADTEKFLNRYYTLADDPEAVLKLDPQLGHSAALRPIMGKDGKVHYQSGALGVGDSISRMINQFVRQSRTESQFVLTGTHSVAEFNDLLHWGELVGMSDRHRAMYLQMFMGGTANREQVARTFLGELFVRSGIADELVVTGEKSRTWYEKYVGKLDHKYSADKAANGVKHAGWHYQTSSAMMLPNYREMFQAIRTTHVNFLARGARGMHYGLFEKLMRKVWIPAQLLRPGFVVRAGGEEAISFMLNPRKGLTGYLAARQWGQWALNRTVRRRSPQHARRLISGDYKNANVMVVRPIDGSANEVYEKALNVSDYFSRSALRTSAGTLEDGEELVLDPLAALHGLGLNPEGREALLMRPWTFITHRIRSMAHIAPDQMEQKIMARAMSTQKTYKTPAEWLAKDRMGFREAVYNARNQTYGELRSVSNAMVWIDELSKATARSAGKALNKAARTAKFPTRRRLAEIMLQGGEMDRLDEATLMMNNIPGVQDVFLNGLSEGTLMDAYGRHGNEVMTVSQRRHQRVVSMPLSTSLSEFRYVEQEDAEFLMSLAQITDRMYDDNRGRIGYELAKAYMFAPETFLVDDVHRGRGSSTWTT
jgi:hypothetical protein